MIVRFSLILMILFFFTIRIYSQDSIDVKSTFKMWLFLDMESVHLLHKKEAVVKNDSLYSLFKESRDYLFDTLASKDFKYFGYEFYSTMLSNSILLKDLKGDTGQYLGLFTGTMDTYILCVNKKTGKSYRLSGFNGNDFLNFLSDACEGFNSYSISIAPIPRNYILDNYHVDGLDFRCLYDGLRAKKMDRNKYRCLKRCSDPISIH
jgi:hypothetical protein